MRIASLLPSATEIVHALGLFKQLVAVTHECDFPVAAAELPHVTANIFDHSDSSSGEIHNHITDSVHRGSSIYHLDEDCLAALRPDLVITQELCEVCAVSYQTVKKAVRLLEGDTQILSLEPTCVEEILISIESVGKLAGVEATALSVIAGLRSRLDVITRACRRAAPVRVLTLEWLEPPFVGGHWVPEMVRMAGGEDVLGRSGEHSREVEWGLVLDSEPDCIILMPCGFDLDRTIKEHSRMDWPQGWHDLPACRNGKVFAVNGSAYFNRPGPRIVDGVEVLAEILNPERYRASRSGRDWQQIGAPALNQ